MQIKIPKRGFTILSIVLFLGVAVFTVSQTKVAQIFYSHATGVTAFWNVTQSATAACNSSGKVLINVSFTNEETSSSLDMIVTATDQTTNKTINLGTVSFGQTVTGTIDTGLTKIAAGSVLFNMSWATNGSGTDTRIADYSSVSQCVAPSPTPTPTEIPTPTSSLPTPTGTPHETPTPTVCPTPGTVKNIVIQCPYCTPTLSPSP